MRAIQTKSRHIFKHVATVALFAMVLNACSITEVPPVVLPNLVCQSGRTDGRYWTFDDNNLNKLFESLDSWQFDDLLDRGNTSDGTKMIIVSQSVKPGTTISRDDPFEFTVVPEGEAKSKWDVPSAQPWPSDCPGAPIAREDENWSGDFQALDEFPDWAIGGSNYQPCKREGEKGICETIEVMNRNGCQGLFLVRIFLNSLNQIVGNSVIAKNGPFAPRQKVTVEAFIPAYMYGENLVVSSRFLTMSC